MTHYLWSLLALLWLYRFVRILARRFGPARVREVLALATPDDEAAIALTGGFVVLLVML